MKRTPNIEIIENKRDKNVFRCRLEEHFLNLKY